MNHSKFLKEIRVFIPEERIYTDALRRLAWGTDASFYRLTPKVVIRSENEAEITRLLRMATKYKVPVTFRAAGTSLSGQSISDSVLIVAGKNWENYHISQDCSTITLQPGLTGGRVNTLLAPHHRKLGPDPASIKSAMVGGIVMNNASGMNCGTHANSDRTLISARMVLVDGTVLDTGDEESKATFRATHPEIVAEIQKLRQEVMANSALRERIRHKYSIKNVTGLNLRPLICYDDPFDIMAHLMVGSEGTLAFLSEVTLRTVADLPRKASAMIYFPTLKSACEGVVRMKTLLTDESEDRADNLVVKSAEMLDWKSLSSVDDEHYLQWKEKKGDKEAEGLTAVLTEVKANSQERLECYIRQVSDVLKDIPVAVPIHFTDNLKEYAPLWAIRSGIFPSVGGTRKPGTTCLIEDIAFHTEDLPEATVKLQKLLAQHGYDDACIYGHALEGNYHFIINQSFQTQEDAARYEALMEDVKRLVVDEFDGSLKAEHGTGRNMAPYVAYEWGEEAFGIMRRIKAVFDPEGLLNPGVIFNDDPHCHLQNFKPLPLLGKKETYESRKAIFDRINRCIECGFCEVNCLTCGLTLSSRQRIALQREMARLEEEDATQLDSLRKLYDYAGEATCAGDGLCATSCPMGINTGDLTHLIRQDKLPKDSFAYAVGGFASKHLHGIKNVLRPLLATAHFAHAALGDKNMAFLAEGLHKVGIPLWTKAMPLGCNASKLAQRVQLPRNNKVVYFPSCINQVMGTSAADKHRRPLTDEMLQLLQRCHYEVIFPKNMDNLCCGTIWESKGMPEMADQKSKELENALWEASEEGRYPVLCDQSPCLQRMRQTIKKMRLYEPAEFIETFLVDNLEFHPMERKIALHVTCSMRKMGLADTILRLARRCATTVIVPEEIGCCGFAGDKGFTHPEVNKYALRKLRPQIEKAGVEEGYSNSRTCEIGLTTNSGVTYRSIVYLVNECTTFKKQSSDQ